MEVMQPDGSARPAGGTLNAFDPPSGPGVRVDHYGYSGYRTNPRFDSLLAKVIVTRPRVIWPMPCAGPSVRCAVSVLAA